MPRYPQIEVELTGHDADPRAIIATVIEALRAGGVSHPERLVFFQEATKGDADQVLRAATDWVTVT